jgi:hypothetical protein
VTGKRSFLVLFCKKERKRFFLKKEAKTSARLPAPRAAPA